MANQLIKPTRCGGQTHPSEEDSVTALHTHTDELFQDFFDELPWGHLWPTRWRRAGAPGPVTYPRVDVCETDDEIEVTADLPGMDEKDVEVTLHEDVLSIRGERKEEQQEKKKKNYRRTECSYGAFERVFSLPREVDHEHAKARFKKGVLTVTLPRTQKANLRQKHIEVSSE